MTTGDTPRARQARAESPAAAALGGADKLAKSFSEQAADAGNAVLDELAGRSPRNSDAPLTVAQDTIINPNGQSVKLSTFVDHEYLAEDHTSIFAKDPATYLREPDPDCMYVWPAKADPHLFARIRGGSYRPVSTGELRDDCALPVTTHTVAGIVHDEPQPDGSVKAVPTSMVAVYDLVLMEVSPQAVKRFYRWPQYQAALRTAQNLPFEQLRQQIEQESRGRATAAMTRTVQK